MSGGQPLGIDSAQQVRLNRLATYFSASIDIRNSIFLQEEDERFCQEEHGVIRYVFDANIVRFFLNPIAEERHVNPFAGKAKEVYAKLAVITAEFLFSRELAGQRGAPAMISPAHMVELGERMDHLLRLLREAVDELEAGQEERRNEVGEAIRLAQSPGSVVASVAKFNEIRPIVDRVGGETHEAQMFERLRRSNLLDPLYLDENAIEAVVKPDPQRVDIWRQHIEAQHTLAQLGRGRQNRPRGQRRNDADAETAEQVVQLNLAAKGQRRPTRYVLVTLDRNLFNAAVTWWDEESREGLDFFPFRRFSQYIPVLNTEYMPNNLDGTDLVTRLRAALDALLGIGKQRLKKFPLFIPETAIRTPEGSFANKLMPALVWLADKSARRETEDRIEALWQQLTRAANYVNAELLRRRDDVFKGFAEFLDNSDNTRAAVVDFMRQNIKRVEAVNIEINLVHSLATEIVMREPYKAGDTAVRGMLIIRERFDDLIEGQSLYAYLDQLVQERKVDKLEKVAQLIRDEPRHRAYYFSGCIAFWAGRWDSAALYALQAAKIYSAEGDRDAALAAELAYFKVVTARFAALDIRDHLARTERELARLEPEVARMSKLAKDTRDAFALARARTEAALWQMSLAFVMTFANPGRAEATALVAEAYALLGEADAEDPRLMATAPHEALETMRIERFVGIAACLIHMSMQAGGRCVAEIDNWPQLSERIGELLQRSPMLAPGFYCVTNELLQVVANRGGPERARATEAAIATIRRLLGEKHHATWFDEFGLNTLLHSMEEEVRRRTL